MCSDPWGAWRDAERLQHYLGMDDGHAFKALVVEQDDKHLADGRSGSWDRLTQALETAQGLPLAPVCVVVSDESTLAALLAANTHPGAPAEIIKRLGTAVYEHHLQAAFAFAPGAYGGALEIRDIDRHRLVVVTGRLDSEGYTAVTARRSLLARWRSGPASLSPRAPRSDQRAPDLTLG
jgi:hypothetical protein